MATVAIKQAVQWSARTVGAVGAGVALTCGAVTIQPPPAAPVKRVENVGTDVLKCPSGTCTVPVKVSSENPDWKSLYQCGVYLPTVEVQVSSKADSRTGEIVWVLAKDKSDKYTYLFEGTTGVRMVRAGVQDPARRGAAEDKAEDYFVTAGPTDATGARFRWTNVGKPATSTTHEHRFAYEIKVVRVDPLDHTAVFCNPARARILNTN